MDKNTLRALAQSVGLDYVCTEKKGKKDVYIFSDRPNPNEYKFREFIFYKEDLTESNMAFCKVNGYSR
jgi:hypothetical protein